MFSTQKIFFHSNYPPNLHSRLEYNKDLDSFYHTTPKLGTFDFILGTSLLDSCFSNQKYKGGFGVDYN